MSSERGCVGSNENWFSFLKGLLIHSSVSMVGVCSLGGIWKRPLKGPFHFCKSPTPPRILHRSSLTIHITSSLSLWQCHLLGHHSPCLPLDLYYIHRCSSTTGLLCPLLIYSLPLPLEISRNSRRCSITGFFCLQILHLIYYLSFFGTLTHPICDEGCVPFIFITLMQILSFQWFSTLILVWEVPRHM